MHISNPGCSDLKTFAAGDVNEPPEPGIVPSREVQYRTWPCVCNAARFYSDNSYCTEQGYRMILILGMRTSVSRETDSVTITLYGPVVLHVSNSVKQMRCG